MDWERLTPGTDDRNDVMLCIQVPGAGHNIAHGWQENGECVKSIYSQGEYLSVAELLALARKSPEVRALVEAVDELLTEAVDLNDHVEDVPVELWDNARAALAPFSEVPGA